MKKVYYCVFKNKKGIIKKKHISNSHLFFIPMKDTFVYLMLYAVDENKPNIYYALAIAEDDIYKQRLYLKEETLHFKGKFQVVEGIPCQSISIAENKQKISLEEPGEHIKSDIFYKNLNDIVEMYGKKFPIIELKFDFAPLFPENTLRRGMKKMGARKKLAVVGNIFGFSKNEVEK
ncbi:MAG: hypothetical protein BWY04_00689 [candidate division CPR1 bacterium ADurb.Bin160]|uniref:Uncharacterized protein n=1 Tax=candidate division CPR1 bacterium ADurb.Bin160 TaxID=1852826 RepID=A0A1V5ZN70_9BACT|nr:MAG: hypothetical protein BWY04_00689 [candidate division CPR1 bacterium ADurb.Bin160]